MAKDATRVFVLPIKGQEAAISKLKALIKAAGCILVCDNADLDDWEKCLAEADVVVLLVCKEAEGDLTFDKIVARASYDGKRVVGIWALDADPGKLPAGLHRHGHAVIPLDAEHVRQSVCGTVSAWLLPDGSAFPTPKTPRHKG